MQTVSHAMMRWSQGRLQSFHLTFYNVQNYFVETFVRVRFWEPYTRSAKKEKDKEKSGGQHARFGDKLCGRPC